MKNPIHIVNVFTEDCSNKNNYFFVEKSKSPSPLANPFTFNGKRTSRAKLSFKTREESVDAYRKYFNSVYGTPGYEQLTLAFNEIYKHYKAGEDVYLGSFSYPNISHADVIAEELQKKLIREKMAERKLN